MQIDDHMLMALADGELDAATAKQVTAAVSADPALQARLRIFTETRDSLKAATPAPQHSDKDAALIAMIRAAQVASATPASQPQPTPKPANLNRRPLMAIAATLALAVVGLGWWQSGGPVGNGIDAAQMAALESLPSGQTQRLDDGRDLTMIASYQTGSGEFCREYETSGQDAQIAIACREGNQWTERFAVSITDNEGYVPAAGEIVELDRFLSQSDMGQPLSPEAETAALTR